LLSASPPLSVIVNESRKKNNNIVESNKAIKLTKSRRPDELGHLLPNGTGMPTYHAWWHKAF